MMKIAIMKQGKLKTEGYFISPNYILYAIAMGLLSSTPYARAEYGDVVINNYADAAGMRPVIFPHWFHRMRFTCKVCHADLGFKLKAGANQITMSQILDGKFCGACHNGEIAWNVENCNTCHSGKPGTPTQVHENTVQKFIAPLPLVSWDMPTYEHKGAIHKLLRPEQAPQ
ncbi:MAG: cytochrome c3 family protein [Gallionellaceae bacterium]|nr:cytochrome c3 family protein [Gallionellaceae bacterium]